MVVGEQVEVIAGVFKGESAKVRIVDTNDTFLLDFDKPELASLREIHFARNEIKPIYDKSGNRS